MSQQIALSQALISLVILAFIWFVLVARIRRDNFRSNIRRIRDNLFDFMCTNNFDFDTPAYRSTRQTLNGMLRCSNYFSVFRLLYVAAILLREGGTQNVATDTIDQLPDGELKNAIKKAKHDAATELVAFIFLRRPSGIFATLLFGAVYYAYAAYGRLKKGSIEKQVLVEQSANHMMGDAYRLGSHPSGHHNNHIAVAS